MFCLVGYCVLNYVFISMHMTADIHASHAHAYIALAVVDFHWLVVQRIAAGSDAAAQKPGAVHCCTELPSHSGSLCFVIDAVDLVHVVWRYDVLAHRYAHDETWPKRVTSATLLPQVRNIAVLQAIQQLTDAQATAAGQWCIAANWAAVLHATAVLQIALLD